MTCRRSDSLVDKSCILDAIGSLLGVFDNGAKDNSWLISGGGGGLAQTSSTESQIFIISAKLKKKRDTLEVFEADWQWASNLPIPPAEGDLPGTVTTSSKHAEPSTSGQDSDGDEHHTELPRKQENSGCQDNSTDRPSGAYSSEPCTRPSEGDLPGAVTTSSKHAEPSTSRQDSDGDEHHTELPRKQENSGCQDNSTDKPSGAYSSPTEPCTRPSEGDLPGAVTTSSKHAEPSTSRQDSDGDEHHTELPRKQENSGCQDNSTDRPSGAYSSPAGPCSRPSESELPVAVNTSSEHAKPSTSGQTLTVMSVITELPRNQESSGCQDNSTDKPSGAYSSPAEPCSRPSESDLPVAVTTSSEHAEPSTSGQDSDGDERDTELPRNQRAPDARITPRIGHQVLIHPPPSHVLVPPRVISQELSLLPANMPSLPHLGRTLTVMSVVLSYHETKRAPDARITPRIDHQVLIHPPPSHVLVPPRVISQ